jgi:hypothetical protein
MHLEVVLVLWLAVGVAKAAVTEPARRMRVEKRMVMCREEGQVLLFAASSARFNVCRAAGTQARTQNAGEKRKTNAVAAMQLL